MKRPFERPALVAAGCGAVALLLLAPAPAVTPAGRSRRAPRQILEELARPGTTPSSATAERLIERVPAARLAELLAEDRRPAPVALRSLGLALTSEEPRLRQDAGRYLLEASRAAERRLGDRGPPWGDEEIELLLTLKLVDPIRFVEEPVFRRAVLELLPEAKAPETPVALRDRLLVEFNQVRGVDFAASERVEWAWGAVPRRSLERQLAYQGDELEPADPLESPITASVYSLSSVFFDGAEVRRLLLAVRALAPERELLVLADPPLASALADLSGDRRVRLMATYGRPYTPWPRDPFTIFRARAGGLRVLLRPDLQARREEDAFLGLELIQNLPDDLDRRWGATRWSIAPVPFHNGHILTAATAVWISVHSVEVRALELLGVDRVPAQSFGSEEGIARYFGAARRAAAELGALYHRPVEFVHPLPERGSLADRRALVERLVGGAGFDLDSLVTLVPDIRGGSPHALVGDLGLGRKIAASLSVAEWRGLGEAYDLEPEPEPLARRLREAQRSPRASALADFVDLVAEHLEWQGLPVERLPLLLVPTDLLRQRADLRHPDFLVTWANVVVERRAGAVRAEGFSGLLPSADEAARAAFSRAGCTLHLLPTLVRSVELLGGYRCASNHLRAGESP